MYGGNKVKFLIFNALFNFQSPEARKLQIREDPIQGIFVQDLSEINVCSKEEIFDLMQRGESNRHYGATNMNKLSSR